MFDGMCILGLPTFIPSEEAIEALGIRGVSYDFKMMLFAIAVTMVIATMIFYKQDEQKTKVTESSKTIKKTEITRKGIVMKPISSHA